MWRLDPLIATFRVFSAFCPPQCIAKLASCQPVAREHAAPAYAPAPAHAAPVLRRNDSKKMPDDAKLTSASVSAMIMYSMSSASMLLVNKLCLKALPLPGLVSTAQFIFSAVAIMLIKVSGVAPVDDFEWKKVQPRVLFRAVSPRAAWTHARPPALPLLRRCGRTCCTCCSSWWGSTRT